MTVCFRHFQANLERNTDRGTCSLKKYNLAFSLSNHIAVVDLMLCLDIIFDVHDISKNVAYNYKVFRNCRDILDNSYINYDDNYDVAN